MAEFKSSFRQNMWCVLGYFNLVLSESEKKGVVGIKGGVGLLRYMSLITSFRAWVL